MLDAYQVYEGRAAGADAILLIVAALTDDQLHDLHTLTTDLGMAALVEVHNEDETERALKLGASLIGINNRDLQTFSTDLTVTQRLAKRIPLDKLIVSESGIHKRADVQLLQMAGAHALLVGESLLRADDVGAKIRELLGEPTKKEDA